MTLAARMPRQAVRPWWLAFAPLALLAACASAPPTSPKPASAPVPVAVAVPAAASAPASALVAMAGVDEPVEAPVPVDPLRPDVKLDLNDRAARVDLWERVRRGFAMPDLSGDLVTDRERWYASRPDYVARMTDRGSRYLFYIVEELDKRGMPTELALLPFIESAYNPQAQSVAAASGMWQFIPSTGRDFELKQNVFRDDRRDVLASTRAALDYLKKLYNMFGDWHLALAAYNWGEGSVTRAIAKNRQAGLPTDYASLRMPNETRQYVPKLQAVKNIIARPADFNIRLPELLNHPYFLSVPIEHDIDVAVAVKLSGLPAEEFRNLNPQMNRPVILAAGTPQVLLPYDEANRFVRELPLHRGPLATWTAWTAPKTMKSQEAAEAVGMSDDDLREINHIPARMLIKAGSTLLVPRHRAMLADVPSTVADTGTLSLAPEVPPLRKISLRAGKRDSVASVARRYRVAPTQVAQWNNVAPGAGFTAGQTIVVFVATASRGSPRGAAAVATVPSRQVIAASARSSRSMHRPARIQSSGNGKGAQHARVASTSPAHRKAPRGGHR